MAFGVFRLSAEDRERLLATFACISMLLCLICIFLVGVSLYVTIFIAPNLHSEKAVIKLIFTVIGMLAMQMAIYYGYGIFVCKKCHTQAFKKTSRYLLRIWIFSGYSSVLNIIIMGTMAASVSNHIVRSMHHSMIRGMKKYLKDLYWKKIIDALQSRLQCCGSRKYTDWHSISWVSSYQIINSSEVIKNFKLNGDRFYMPGVPWSCCRLGYSKQCFHDPIQQYQYSGQWDSLAPASIYQTGCVELLKEPIENSFLFFILASYILLILQLILSLISRYLYTSYRNSVILGDPFGLAPGWIFEGNVFEEMNMKGSSTSGTSFGTTTEGSEESIEKQLMMSKKSSKKSSRNT